MTGAGLTTPAPPPLRELEVEVDVARAITLPVANGIGRFAAFSRRTGGASTETTVTSLTWKLVAASSAAGNSKAAMAGSSMAAMAGSSKEALPGNSKEAFPGNSIMTASREETSAAIRATGVSGTCVGADPRVRLCHTSSTFQNDCLRSAGKLFTCHCLLASGHLY